MVPPHRRSMLPDDSALSILPTIAERDRLGGQHEKNRESTGPTNRSINGPVSCALRPREIARHLEPHGKRFPNNIVTP